MKKKNVSVLTIVAFIIVVMVFAYAAVGEAPPKPIKITIDPAKTALVLLHWQNDIASSGGKFAGNIPERLAAARNIEHTQAALKASREKGILIIYINASHRPGYPELPSKAAPLMEHVKQSGALIRGTWGAEIIDQLKPLGNEIVVLNYSTSGFCNTDLDVILRSKGITDLVLTGLATNFVVESTTRDAVNRGYFVYILADCCNSPNDHIHNWALKNILPAFAIISNSKDYIDALRENK